MSDVKSELDINETFENLLLAEEIAQDSGYAEGYDAGKRQLVNGYHLGYHRASLLAAQLGYCAGTLEHFLYNQRSAPEKAISAAKDVLRDIYQFPRHNDDSVDILQTIERIKSKYAKFCALAKISSAYPETDRLDF